MYGSECLGTRVEEYHSGELLLSVYHVGFGVFRLYGKCLYTVNYVVSFCQRNFHAIPDIQVAK